MQRCEILNSKLAAPTVSETFVRNRLISHFDALLNHKITIITAGAGYGKSTFVSQACNHLGVSKVWYRLEESDRDPVTFISYIVAGIRKTNPGYGETLDQRLSDFLSGRTINTSALTVLVNELEQSVTDETILVFDDCHQIDDSEEAKGILLFFIEHLPSNVHIVMISRNAPVIPLSKFRVRLELHEITQDDLAFSTNETARLYKQLFGFTIPENSLRNLEGKTEGWVSGLILFYHLSKGKNHDQIEALLKTIKGTHKIFREYMGENVFELQKPDVRDFLMQTSIFNQMDTGFCDRFLGIDRSEEILSDLEKNHLFTSSVDDDKTIYSYHHLFQEFLRNRFTEEKGREGVQKSHHRAASLYEQSGFIDKALGHYLKAESYQDVFSLLGMEGRNLILQGRHRTLDTILNRIPEHYHQEEPWPLALKAIMCTSVGELNRSIRYNLVAQEMFEKRGMVEAAATNLMELGRTWYLIGDFEKAENAFNSLLENESVPPENKLEVLGHLIFITAAIGNITRSDACFQEAQLLLERIEKNRHYIELNIWVMINYAFHCQFKGDFPKAVEYSDSVLSDIKNTDSWIFMTYYCHISSITHMLMGDLDTAWEKVNLGLSIIGDRGFQGTQEAWLYMCSAMLKILSGNLKDAEGDLKKGTDIFRRGGSRWGEATMLVLYTILYSRQGFSEKAVATVTEGLATANELKLPWVEGKLCTFSAIAMIKTNEFQHIPGLLDHAAEVLHFSVFEQCQITIVRALYHWASGETDAACNGMIEALETSQAHEFGAWTFFSLPGNLELLVNVYISGRMQPYILKLFRDYGYRDADSLLLLQKQGNRKIKKAVSEIISELPKPESPSLKVYCLGRFRVFVGDREILSQEWKSTKARDIFKYLVLSRKRGAVNKEVLLELIWPEEDSGKTLKRLHVALPALRKTLEPDVRRGESQYLVRDKESYTIDIGKDGFVDVERFVAEIKFAEKDTGGKAVHHLIQAESLYKGELFGDDLYAEWCFEEREQLNRLYLSVIDKILTWYESQQNHDKCIEYAEKYLDADSYAEEIYIKLMTLYHETGNHAMVVKTWEKCRKNIEEDLSCPLSDEAIELHDRLVRSGV